MKNNEMMTNRQFRKKLEAWLKWYEGNTWNLLTTPTDIKNLQDLLKELPENDEVVSAESTYYFFSILRYWGDTSSLTAPGGLQRFAKYLIQITAMPKPCF